MSLPMIVYSVSMMKSAAFLPSPTMRVSNCVAMFDPFSQAGEPLAWVTALFDHSFAALHGQNTGDVHLSCVMCCTSVLSLGHCTPANQDCKRFLQQFGKQSQAFLFRQRSMVDITNTLAANRARDAERNLHARGRQVMMRQTIAYPGRPARVAAVQPSASCLPPPCCRSESARPVPRSPGCTQYSCRARSRLAPVSW